MNKSIYMVGAISAFALVLSACATTSETSEANAESAEMVKAEMSTEAKVTEEVVETETVAEVKMPEAEEAMSEDAAEMEKAEPESEKEEKSDKKSDKKTLVQSFSASMEDTHAAVLAALKVNGFEVRKSSDEKIEAKRTNKFGVIAGSGGEKMYVNLAAIDENNTEVSVRTKKTLLGYAMQKNWNDEVMEAIAQTLK